MPITRDEVHAVAALARLRLDAGEEDGLAADLGRILEYVDRLRALDTTDVPPTAHVEDDAETLRDDAVTNPAGTDALLANAPDRDGRFFRVPKIVE